MVVGVALVLACTPAEPAESSGTLATGSTGASGGTDGVSSTGGASVPTTGGPAETTSEGSGEGSSAGDTGSSTGDSTGEPVRPGCGDGVLAAGELCFERIEQELFPWPPEDLVLVDLDGDGLLDVVARTADVVFGRVVAVHIADEALTPDGLVDVLKKCEAALNDARPVRGIDFSKVH